MEDQYHHTTGMPKNSSRAKMKRNTMHSENTKINVRSIRCTCTFLLKVKMMKKVKIVLSFHFGVEISLTYYTKCETVHTYQKYLLLYYTFFLGFSIFSRTTTFWFFLDCGLQSAIIQFIFVCGKRNVLFPFTHKYFIPFCCTVLHLFVLFPLLLLLQITLK